MATLKDYFKTLNEKYAQMTSQIDGAFTIEEVKRLAKEVAKSENEPFYEATMTVSSMAGELIAELIDPKFTAGSFAVIYPKTEDDKHFLYDNLTNIFKHDGVLYFKFKSTVGEGAVFTLKYKVYTGTNQEFNYYLAEVGVMSS